jgi:hypothetical protein
MVENILGIHGWLLYERHARVFERGSALLRLPGKYFCFEF